MQPLHIFQIKGHFNLKTCDVLAGYELVSTPLFVLEKEKKNQTAKSTGSPK